MNAQIKELPRNNKAEKMNLDDTTLIGWAWSLVGLSWTSIIGLLIYHRKRDNSQFRRLRSDVDEIKKNYVKDSQYEKAIEKIERLDSKFDDKTTEITNMFITEHGKTQKMLVDLAKTIGEGKR